MEEKTWLDYLTAVGSVATPILVLLLSAIGWRLRQRLERRVALEEKLRSDRVAIYNEILEPFIILLMSQAAWESDSKNRSRDKDAIASQKLLSLDYRQKGFRLSLMGSDEVVWAYNNLMQYFFQRGAGSDDVQEADIRQMLALLGAFLLAIRKSMGNEATKIDKWGMLEWFVNDARRFRD